MRLISARIQNYRIHKDLRISFDGRLTLIGGPNESGKSTLVEAIHRCLFLKAKGNTQWHRSMASLTHGGTPEVEVELEVRGEIYRLTKRFSGNNGTVRLVGPGGAVSTGDRAEGKLKELLAIEQTNRNDIQEQWSHLWVWQGSSSGDPAKTATGEHDGLINRLQALGGAVTLQSELDASVAAQFQEEYEKIFTNNGAPRRGSELEKANTAIEEAEMRLSMAESVLAKLQTAAEAFRQSGSALERLAADKKKVDADRERNEKLLYELQALREREREQAMKAEIAAERYRNLEDLQKRITGAELEIEERSRKLAPGEIELGKLSGQLKTARDELKLKSQAVNAAGEQVGRAESLKDYFDTHERLFDLERQGNSLKQRLEQIGEREAEITRLEHTLAELQQITEANVAELRQVDDDLRESSARLGGMSTEIEVLESGGRLEVHGESLGAGALRMFAETIELQYEGLRLRVKPGGGDSLEEARETERLAKAKRKALMERLGVTCVEEAAAIAAKRSELGLQVKHAREALKNASPQKTKAEWEDLHARILELQTKLNSLKQHASDISPPADAPAARLALAEAKEAFTHAKAAEREAAIAREAASEHALGCESKVDETRRNLDAERQALEKARALFAALEGEHGDEERRSARLIEARSERDASAAALQETRGKISALQPEMLESDHGRFERAAKAIEVQTQQARESRAAAQATLQRDGENDPSEEVEIARAQLESARESESRIAGRSFAINLLNKLFKKEQAEVAERFSAPLAKRVSEYLKAIYGPGAEAALEVSKDCVSGITLRRANLDGIGYDFLALSMGAREQAAAAVRLAIAEVLANCPSDCLPVVFDDAFTNSDPERTAMLQRMLDHAAGKGLQIIVITCNPSDYAALGASTTFQMQAPIPGAGAAAGGFTEGTNTEAGAGESTTFGDNPEPEQLLARLSEMGGQAGNQSLRDALEWDDATYERIRDLLVESGKLEKGRGRGGSVMLPGPDGSLN